ncbi:MAG: acyl-CoA desaturase, partial [Nocardioides sp.]
MTPPTATATRPADIGPDIEPQTATWGGDIQSRKEQIALGIFIVVPFLAVIAAVPIAWGGWLGWSDVVIMVLMYWLTGHGITVGFHRLFTHKSYKPNRAVKIFWAIAGSMAIQGPVIRWVADHRKHHKFSDRDGDPHSPWRYGKDLKALTKGFLYAHLMWLFSPEQTPQRKYAPDLMKDRDIVRISRQFPLWVAVSLVAPAVLGGLVTMSWQGALTAFYWASLVRVALLH